MKVAKIVDPEFKTGKSAKGPWTLIKIETESGVVATGFGPITVGDEVDLERNEQYNNYSFKKLKPSDIPTVDVNEDLKQTSSVSEGQFRLLYGELRAIHKIVKALAGETVVDPTPDEISGEDEIEMPEEFLT